MFSSVLSAALLGINCTPIHVEADVVSGLPMFEMVGYLSSEVKEAKERVKAAIRNSGVNLPPKRITVNLSPADVRKAGAMYDLPVAGAVLASLGVFDSELLKDTIMIGELSLNGKVRPVHGVLPIVIAAKEYGCRQIFLPEENRKEASAIEGIRVIGLESLVQFISFMKTGKWEQLDSAPKVEDKNITYDYKIDFSEINGQYAAKRAAEIASAGMHNILFVGPPGAGKTMIAMRMPTILTKLSLEESLTITKIYSVSGNLPKNSSLLSNRPFRNPHHTITKGALIGGGIAVKPGEVSLAHGGVLFLDELPEFNKSVLETLRQPMQDRSITLVRGNRNYTYPTDFMLVAAMNPCRCGYYPDLNKCTCTQTEVNQYLNRVSKPLLDRIDLTVELPRMNYQELTGKKENESSEIIRERVAKAHQIQLKRYEGKGICFNASLPSSAIKEYCKLGKKEEALIKRIFDKFDISARVYHKIIRVARTIADLSGEENIKTEHISEAVCYRTFEQKYNNRR